MFLLTNVMVLYTGPKMSHWGLLLEVQYNTELTVVRYFLKSENQYCPCDP